jgi:hypothetical protein
VGDVGGRPVPAHQHRAEVAVDRQAARAERPGEDGRLAEQSGSLRLSVGVGPEAGMLHDLERSPAQQVADVIGAGRHEVPGARLWVIRRDRKYSADYSTST